MRSADEGPVTLVPLGSRGSSARAWIAAGTLIAVLVGLVGAGALGGGESADQPGGSPRPDASAAAVPAPSRRAPTGPIAPARGGRVVAPGHAGYAVAYPRDQSHRPIIFDDGALAIFGFGERVPDGSYPGVVRVAVGTPAGGAAVPGRGGVRYVYAATTAELVRDYLRHEPYVPVARSATNVGAAFAIILDFRAETVATEQWSVALVAHGGRTFVVTATGFGSLYPGEAAPARNGLLAFLRQLRFTTGLFSDRDLGFQVPFPVDASPVAIRAVGDGEQAAVLFADGDPLPGRGHSHSISVAVGTRERPALVQALGGGDPTAVDRIWAASLVELQGAYVAAIGGRAGSSTTIRVDGELALLVERPNGLAATVLAVRHGRAYVISTTGRALREPGPGFVGFLEAFTFLDDSP